MMLYCATSGFEVAVTLVEGGTVTLPKQPRNGRVDRIQMDKLTERRKFFKELFLVFYKSPGSHWGTAKKPSGFGQQYRGTTLIGQSEIFSAVKVCGSLTCHENYSSRPVSGEF